MINSYPNQDGHYCPLRSQRGVGLIETLLIVLFIGVGVIALVKFQNYLAFSSGLAQQRNDAAILAAKQLETLRDFVVVNAQGTYSAYDNIVTGSSTTSSNNTAFTLAWTITTSTSPAYKNMTVNVTWTDRIGGSQTLQLISTIAGVDPGSSAAFM